MLIHNVSLTIILITKSQCCQAAFNCIWLDIDLNLEMVKLTLKFTQPPLAVQL